MEDYNYFLVSKSGIDYNNFVSVACFFIQSRDLISPQQREEINLAIKNYRQIPKLFWISAFVLFLFFCLSVILTFSVKGTQAAVILSDISSPIYSLVGAGALSYAAWQTRKTSRKNALGWEILAVGQLLFALGDICWAVLELVFQVDPFPSIADIAYLSFYPLMFIGIFVLPAKQMRKSEWLKRGLDMAIVMVVATFGIWIYLINPILQGFSAGIPLLISITSIAYPIGDLIFLLAILMIVYSRSDRTPFEALGLFFAGALFFILTDFAFAYQSNLGVYHSGSWLDLGWVAASILITLAGIYQGVTAKNYPKEDTLPRQPQVFRIKFRAG